MYTEHCEQNSGSDAAAIEKGAVESSSPFALKEYLVRSKGMCRHMCFVFFCRLRETIAGVELVQKK